MKQLHESWSKMSDKINKNSYPNFDEFQQLSEQRDIKKWLDSAKAIYFQENNGVGRNAAFKTITAQWDEDEVKDFTHWLKYYEEGSHLKYKKAQSWFEGAAPGYFLPLQYENKRAVEEPTVPGKDIDYAKNVISNEMTEKEKKSIIENTRKKFISRLDSAEKVLRTSDGELFVGKEMEAIVEALFNIKKKILLINKISTSTKIYDDIIIREANVLNKNGFTKAGNHLSKLAQDALPAELSPLPTDPATGGLPAQPTTDTGGLPGTAAPDPAEDQKTAVEGFLNNMETANFSISEDEEEEQDEKQADDDLSVDDDELLVWDDLFVVAQAAPAPLNTTSPPPEAPTAPATEAPADATLNPTAPAGEDKLEQQFEQLFANTTVEDVVAKLDELANIFRTREIPRQLSFVDIMLDHLNLASMFPNLSEAINKSLESNNYCLTRVEDITSKLRGTINAPEMNLSGDGTSNPVKDKLQSDLDKEKARKEKRKEMENSQFDAATTPKETPQIELEDPNAPPAAVPGSPPVA